MSYVSRDSSVGVAPRYGLHGPENEYRWGRDLPHAGENGRDQSSAPPPAIINEVKNKQL
jgi:hypothetical protein